MYSRYVPNLTRQDGSAFERLLMQSGAGGEAINAPNKPKLNQQIGVQATEPAKEVSHG